MLSAADSQKQEHAAVRRVLCFLCVLCCLIATYSGAAQAATPGSVFALQPVGRSGHPGYFVLSARPGMTLTRKIRVADIGTRAGTVLLYGVDATTGETTGAVYLTRRDPRRDVGAWIKLDAGALRLSPNESRKIAFTITVPRGAADGQHLGGVVAENAAVIRGHKHHDGRGSFRIDVRTLTIVAVELNLPGARRERMTITGIRPGAAGGHQFLLVGLRNNGNQLTRGSGRITIRDQEGVVIHRAGFPLDTFVPHTGITDPVLVPGRALAAGTYDATVTLRYGSGRTTRLNAEFTISRRQVEQVFGARSQQAPRSGASGPSLLMLAVGAIGLLAAGFSTAVIVLRRRPSSHDPKREPQA